MKIVMNNNSGLGVPIKRVWPGGCITASKVWGWKN
jgi:hypothetical protein